MRIWIIAIVASMPTWLSAQNLTVQEWLDVYVELCVGSGSSFVASGEVKGDGKMSLKTLSLNGSLEGSVVVSKSEYRLLSEGITNSISDAAASQASEIRKCLEPMRNVLIQAMTQDLTQASGVVRYILSPQENAVLRYISNTRGPDGKTGKGILIEDIARSVSGMSELRLASTLNELEGKFLVFESVAGGGIDIVRTDDGRLIGSKFVHGQPAIFLTDTGIDYVLNTGLAK